MCIAIINPSNKTLTKETLNNCWLNNDDGAGFLYIQDGKLKAFKEMKSFNKFFNKYMNVKKSCPESNIVLHFRISTHGVVNKTNCHPFFVNNDLGFVHNGVIYGVKEDPRFSDTYMFNKTILKNLPASFEQNETIMDLLQDFIGNGSKLAFLDSSNNYYLVNEEAGHWNDGCWFSNHSYESVSAYVDYGGTKVYRGYNNSRSGYSSYGSSRGYGGFGGWSAYDEDDKGWNDSFGVSSSDDDDERVSIPSFTEDELDMGYKAITGFENEHLRVVDSGHVCKDCGSYAKDGEIFTKSGKCMECASHKETRNVSMEVYDHGHEHEYLDGVSFRFTTDIGERVIRALEDVYVKSYNDALAEQAEADNDCSVGSCEIMNDKRCEFCQTQESTSSPKHYVEDWDSTICSDCYTYTGAELMERRKNEQRKWEDDNLAG